MRALAPRRLGGWRRPAGFTLVEMLIALVLLSLLMLVLTSALRSMGQVEERIEERIEQADDFRLASQLLAGVLARVSARRHALDAELGGAQVPFFEAGPDSLAWIGVMPARFGLGGRHYMRLALEHGAAGAQLVLRYAPWTGEPGFAAWNQADAQVLAAPVQALFLRYQEPVSGAWTEVWPPPGLMLNDLPPNLLPVAVTIQVAGPVPDWPPMVLPVMAAYATDPAVSRGAFGGGRR